MSSSQVKKKSIERARWKLIINSIFVCSQLEPRGRTRLSTNWLLINSCHGMPRLSISLRRRLISDFVSESKKMYASRRATVSDNFDDDLKLRIQSDSPATTEKQSVKSDKTEFLSLHHRYMCAKRFYDQYAIEFRFLLFRLVFLPFLISQ